MQNQRLSRKNLLLSRSAWLAGALSALAALMVLFLSMPRAAAWPVQSGSRVSTAAAASATEKLRKLQQPSGGATNNPVTFSEDEVNSYLYYQLAPRYPSGVSNIQARFTAGVVHGSCEIDFDRLKASRAPGGMLGYLFSGSHALTVEGGLSGSGGVGHFDLGAVALDGVPLPATLVHLLIDNYLAPRYPGLSLDKPFPLPDPIDRVQVGLGVVEAESGPPSN